MEFSKDDYYSKYSRSPFPLGRISGRTFGNITTE